MGGYIGPGIATQIDGYTQSQTDAKLTPTNVSDKDNASTGAFDLPSGTTAQRPASPNTGYTRYNTTIGAVETWNGTAWVTSGGLVLQAVQTANFTATAGNSYPVNTTSAAVTVTLPASPTAGQQVNVFDYAGTASTYAITLNPNGGKINGVAINSAISTNRESVTLVYVDSSQGWTAVSHGSGSAITPATYSATYLIVAGGGGGGQDGGGGGGGGLLSGASTLTAGTAYPVVVGAGGAGATGSYTVTGGSGTNSSINSISAIGGGGGGTRSLNSAAGVSGGSGGGGSGIEYAGAGGSGTLGQGYAGGSGTYTGGTTGGYGGGGGSSSAGSNGSTGGGGSGGAGGSGTSSSISGTAVSYAGGGGGGHGGTGTGGYGGAGAGDGATYNGNVAGNGSANFGGGGGGGGRQGGYVNGGNGGSGVVILSVPTVSYSGVTTGSPTVTTSGSNTIIKFTSSGSYTA